MENKNESSRLTRRDFLGKTAAATAAFTIVPSYVVSGLGHKAPSDKLNIAGVGIGGRGGSVVRAMNSENIVALCDVDWKYAASTFEEYPNAKKYWDWRKMFDEMADDIDAVVVGTPDHTHAIISINAMKLGKHVYCEKPLTHAVWESREMTRVANEYKVVTQMGNQGNSSDDIRKICEWIWNDEIGEVEEVHAWTNRPIWPQGLERPETGQWAPDHLNWDLFIGPAKKKPYHSIFHPWNWRGWWDYGTGALGDMACHILDPITMALKLKYPTKVQGTSTQINTESAPEAEMAQFVFPERDKHKKVKMPEVKVTWWDGGFLPPRPDELPDGVEMGKDKGGGCLFIGSKGKLMCGVYARHPWILGRDEEPDAPKVLRRIELNHQMDFVRACKDGYEKSVENDTLPSSNFNYSGPLNEMVAMGVVAVRLQSLKRELEWDGEKMEFTNISDNDELRVVKSDKFEVIDGHPHFDTQYVTMNAKETAKEYIKHTYRDGWTL